jgi:hypothetical protein
MKAIFLDIDGVLNSTKSMHQAFLNKSKEEQGFTFPDNPTPEHISHLSYICEQTGAKIVISSTWRIGNSYMILWRFLQAMGLKGQVIGKTPQNGKCRGDEIKLFIENHNLGKDRFLHNDPVDPITSFVILDDDADMGELMDHLVQTNSEEGLQREHALKAIEILNN